MGREKWLKLCELQKSHRDAELNNQVYKPVVVIETTWVYSIKTAATGVYA
jgi:hypothetical protein